jgi:hypothetical protein
VISMAPITRIDERLPIRAPAATAQPLMMTARSKPVNQLANTRLTAFGPLPFLSGSTSNVIR